MPKVLAELVYSIAEAYGSEIPDVPTPDDIDLEELARSLGKASVDDLIFDTRPIGKVTESRNGRKYSEQSVLSLVEQVKNLRPEGRWGHLSEAEASSRYEIPAVRWINAVYQESNQTAYGKLVAVTEEAERHLKSAKALRAKVGTSIYAHNPVMEGKEVRGYSLVTIDLANAERVGIYDMNSTPKISKEMNDSEKSNNGELLVTDEEKAKVAAELAAKNEQKIAETTDVKGLRSLLHANDLKLAEMQPMVNNLGTIAELLNTEPDNAVVKVRELQTSYRNALAENVALLGATITVEVAEAVKAGSVRDIIAEQVTDLKPSSRTEVKSAIAKVLEKPSIKKLLETAVVAESGGNLSETGGSKRTSATLEPVFE